MKQSDTFIVAEEGWRCLAILVGLFVFFTLIDAELLQLLSSVAFVLIAYAYRNPERVVPYYQPKSIVAVADGLITSIETVEDTKNGSEPCYKIEIRSGHTDTALLRAPFESCVKYREIRRGSRLASEGALAKKLNEKAELHFVDAEGNQMRIEHLLGQSMHPLSVRVVHEQKLMQGGRYGLMLKGSHTLYLPLKSRIAVKVGEHVRAGESLLGYFS